MKKLWAGRFKGDTQKVMENFSESISFDQRLWRHDIAGSIAHAKMLGRQGIIPQSDVKKIISGLNAIAKDIESGKFKFSIEYEDVHMNIEAELIRRIGDAGARLHTARSRNDQVATDVRMYLRDVTLKMLTRFDALIETFKTLAERYMGAIMPGYTHLQRAQPVLLSHYLLAYAQMFLRDKERFSDCLKRINVMPLGSSALAGTTLPIDRHFVAKELGFDAVSENSIDAVSDRDFAIEFCSCASIFMMHASRLAEEFVLWSSEEFKFVEISDAFCTGSSLMPQKKNPDAVELIRGKTGRVYGSLTSLLTIMKALPLAYNRDMQEDKVALFDAVDTVLGVLEILNAMLPEVRFNTELMHKTAVSGYSTATDIAEYLVAKGVPFRTAHEITGRIVRYAIDNQKELKDLTLAEYQGFCDKISDDIYKAVDVVTSVQSRKSYGGTSETSVKRQLKNLKTKPSSK